MKKPAVLLVLLLAAALRLYKVDMLYWVDELVTRERAGGTLWEAMTRSSYPLNDVLAWITTHLADTEWALRLPSVLAGVAGVAAAYWVGKKAGGRMAGLFAALLLAVSPFHIEHSQDARYYAFIMLFAMLSLGVLIGLAAGLTFRRLAAFAGLTALGLLMHPFYAFAGAGIAIAYAAHVIAAARRPLTRRLRQVALVGAATAAGFLPLALLTAPRLVGAVANASADPETAPALSRPLYRLGLGEYGGYLKEIAGSGVLAAAVFAFAALGLAVLLRRRSPLALAAVIFLLLPLPLLLVDVKHWYHSRYFSYVLPALVVMAGAGAAWLSDLAKARGARLEAVAAAVAAAALAIAAWPAVASYYGSQCPRDNWGRAAQFIAARMNEGDVVFHASTYSMQPGNNQYRSRVLEYYLKQAQPPAATRQWISHSGAETQPLLEVLQQFPDRSIWIAADHSMIAPELTDLIGRLSGAPLLRGNPSLYVVGEPTENLAIGGGFEEPLHDVPLADGIALAPSPIPGGGANCLVMQNGVPDGNANVKLNVVPNSAEAVLEEGQACTLSLELKLEDVRPGSNPSRVAKVVVSGKNADGEAFWHELLRIQGTADWRRYVFRVRPGRDLPAGARDVQVRAGLFGGTGTVWVDNVQLEAKPWATPFVQGQRFGAGAAAQK